MACSEAKKRGGLNERRPIPLLSYLDANAACQSTARGSENTLPPSKTAQVSPFGQLYSTLIYIAWPAKMRSGLKERRPIHLPSYLDANAACQSTARGSENTLLPSETAQVSPFGHTSTQTLHVSRLPGDQRTRSHPPKPRRFLRSASRHSTLIYIAWPAKKRVGLKERRPIPLPS